MTQEEFISVILPLKDRLFRIAWHITRCREEAEDIVQDVMVKVWNREGSSEQIINIEAYCYTMARNLALNHKRAKQNNQEQLSPEKEGVAEEGPSRWMEQHEKVELLHRLMEQLSLPQRDIIQLRDIEGMNYLDIAQTLQLTEEQVKVYLFRARKKIKDWYLKLENYGVQTD